jgi:cytochrome c-type biogenesis protein CcmH
MIKVTTLLWLPLLLALLGPVGAAYAQDPTRQVADDDVNRVARELYCPICDNETLDVCKTQACEDWRQLIREKLAAGQTDQQIMDYFVDLYGEQARKVITDDDVNRVARELYCPICENTPLDVCETQACEDWREEIRAKLAAGQTAQQIINYFAGIYGERARATPTTQGFSKWVWIIPIAGAALFGVYFVRLLLRWRARAAELETPTAASQGLDQAAYEYIAQLEQDIRESA